jgi:hypothetical protein
LIELHVILRHKGDGTTRPTSARSSAHPSKHHKLALSIEKGEAVLYRDFVTILRGESLEYITKLATPQSQKPRSPLPQIIMQCTPKTHQCGQLNFSCTQNTVDRPLCSMYSPVLLFIFPSTNTCLPKSIQVYIHGDENI